MINRLPTNPLQPNQHSRSPTRRSKNSLAPISEAEENNFKPSKLLINPTPQKGDDTVSDGAGSEVSISDISKFSYIKSQG
jgi:hypothetical protein